jgi:hypothetical protein
VARQQTLHFFFFFFFFLNTCSNQNFDNTHTSITSSTLSNHFFNVIQNFQILNQTVSSDSCHSSMNQ